jgi:hypothetical protein
MSKINDRPIVAGSAREKALIAQRLKARNDKFLAARSDKLPVAKRAIKTTTTTVVPKRKSRGFPKLKAAANKRAAALKKIK